MNSKGSLLQNEMIRRLVRKNENDNSNNCVFQSKPTNDIGELFQNPAFKFLKNDDADNTYENNLLITPNLELNTQPKIKPELGLLNMDFSKSYSLKSSRIDGTIRRLTTTDDNTQYSNTINNSNLSFKRKYSPNIAIEEKPMEMAKKNLKPDYDKKINSILKIIDFGENSSKPSKTPSNYSYYAVFFMVIANLVGLILTCSFQILLYFKKNCDTILIGSLNYWQQRNLGDSDKKIILIALALPFMVMIIMCYICLWTLYNLNAFLLYPVPDRFYRWLSFGNRI